VVVVVVVVLVVVGASGSAVVVVVVVVGQRQSAGSPVVVVVVSDVGLTLPVRQWLSASSQVFPTMLQFHLHVPTHIGARVVVVVGDPGEGVVVVVVVGSTPRGDSHTQRPLVSA
jgi:hypothetical protein